MQIRSITVKEPIFSNQNFVLKNIRSKEVVQMGEKDNTYLKLKQTKRFQQ